MNYYPQLLSAIFHTFGGTDPKCLALGCSSGGSSILPGVMPPGSIFEEIDDYTEFVNRSVQAVADSNADCVFAVPFTFSSCIHTGTRTSPLALLQTFEKLASALVAPDVGGSGGSTNNLRCLAMLVPSHFSTMLKSSRWRQLFFPAHSSVLIEHSHGNFASSIGINVPLAVGFTTVVFLRASGPIRFFKISDEAFGDGQNRIISDLEKLLKQTAGKTRFGYVYPGALDESYPCSYDYYSEETEKLRQEVGVLGTKVRLGDVADVLIGYTRIPSGRADEGASEILTISGRDITLDGRVDLLEVRSSSAPAIVKACLQDGDFCMRAITSATGRLAVGVYQGDDRQISADSSVIIIRPHPSLSLPQRQVLLSYLRSPIGYRLAGAKQGPSQIAGAIRISLHVVADFPVPIADEDLSSSIDQLSAAKSAFREWIEEIDKEANAIIEESTATGSRTRLLNAGRLARQRHRAAEQVNTLDYRIRTQFPHPLAFAWRKFQVSGNDRYHRLNAVLKAAENHTCFLALIAILISHSLNQPISYVGEMAKRLSERKSGTNFGDWLAIVTELNGSKSFRPQKDFMPFAELGELCSRSPWPEAIAKLKKMRDDDSHGRISRTNVPSSLVAEAELALEHIYQSTDFLTDYQLLFITETRFDSIRKINRLQYRDLTGDNPLSAQREEKTGRIDIESGSLYLRDRRGILHLFRPLLHYLECPESHRMSTFYLDTFDGRSAKSLVGIKSFETNSVRHESLAAEFRHVGLLL